MRSAVWPALASFLKRLFHRSHRSAVKAFNNHCRISATRNGSVIAWPMRPSRPVCPAKDVRPYEAIIATATDRGCDLIVMASHGRGGLSAIVLGSVTNKVLTHTKV